MNCDNTVQKCSDFLLNAINSMNIRYESILQIPLRKDAFSMDLLKYQWEPLVNNDEIVSDFNFDLLVDLSMKKAITDTLISITENNDENNNDENMVETTRDNLMDKLGVTATILDFCFHSRLYRKNADSWIVTYFDLFQLVTDLLNWPIDIEKFWSYPETRIDWFKLQNTEISEDEFNGISYLVSYKPPISDKLRHWNDWLELIEYNSSLNTPLHYKMKYKLLKFLSDLLPIYEESNFNRSSMVSRKQQSGNIWNQLKLYGRPTTPQEKLTDDYRFIFDKILTSPIEFTFKAIQHKLDIDTAFSPLLDAIFNYESDFYKKIKYNHRGNMILDTKLNENFQSDFDVSNRPKPKYITQSLKFQSEKRKLWNEIISFQNSHDLYFRSTLFDISTFNSNALFSQMTKPENDYYRKQFVLQIVFVIKLIQNILTNDEIKAFYKTCYHKEDLLKFVNFDNIEDNNIKKTLDICKHLTETRINAFYVTRDKLFHSVINNLSKSDSNFLKAKMDNFKFFQTFNITKQETKEYTIDYNFKKFGFIKLGNKQISNVWKIKTGIDLIPQHVTDPKEIYDKLKSNFQKEQEEIDMDMDEEGNSIVKQWQNLRALRSEYLFDFNKVDEKNGLKGLFDPKSDSSTKESHDAIYDDLNMKIRSVHQKKLEEARKYIEEKAKAKDKAIEDTKEDENDISKEGMNIDKKEEEDGVPTDDSTTENNTDSERKRDVNQLEEENVPSPIPEKKLKVNDAVSQVEVTDNIETIRPDVKDPTPSETQTE